MAPTAPAAPVTRIGLVCSCFVVMSLTLGYVQRRTGGARAGTNGRRHTPGGFARMVCSPSSRSKLALPCGAAERQARSTVPRHQCAAPTSSTVFGNAQSAGRFWADCGLARREYQT
jgi:hypothetical protein